ncbi:MAG TPA: divalent-cation tolerance protein CutA [Candidatus Binataceae bacterium]|nr:divalent-cation tolerance protein CutA [Candidatus Binataceae bacterium]
MSAASSRATLVIVTTASEEQAASIARALVGERLAACVNIVGPIRSIYRWQGEVQDDSEYLILIKTRTSLASKVERRVRQLHSYEVPEVIVLSIAAGSKPYLEWLLASTTSAPVRGAPKGRRKN